MGVIPWKKALVIGLGASGRAAARLLLHHGCAVRGYDRSSSVSNFPVGVEFFLGEDQVPAAAFEGIDLLVLSPGLDPGEILRQKAERCPRADVHGELSLGLWVLRRAWPAAETVLITGTNGKSTVTSMLGHLLAAQGEEVFVGGNLGPALCDRVVAVHLGKAPTPRFFVLECSSYQLETLSQHPTRVAMVLNISLDHIDRYPSMRAYADTKGRVFRGLEPGGLALLDSDDSWTHHLRTAVPRGKLVLVDGEVPPRFEAASGRLVLNDEESVARGVLRLAGRHNAKNALFALAAARHLELSWSECCRQLATFEGLPHRMSHVATVDDIAYYNDSKATNVASVLASLGGFERQFVLIAGGRAKGEDLSPLHALLDQRGRGLVVLGESANLLLEMAAGVVPTRMAVSMDQAVAMAREIARPGDAVVLSPACASWDMYANFGERGRAFVAAVNAVR
ncbi:MAG: UDP-N-acetylmuramoyl-L-alanine--D-glutamate ligase [Nannocystaceae bacterium]